MIAQSIIFGSVWLLSSPSTQHHGTSRTSASGAPLPPWCQRYSASACCQRYSACCPHIAARRGQRAQGGERQWGAHHDDQHTQQQRHQEISGYFWVLYVRLSLWAALLLDGTWSGHSTPIHPEASILHLNAGERQWGTQHHGDQHIQHQQLRQRQEFSANSLKSEAIFEPFKCSQCSSDQSLA